MGSYITDVVTFRFDVPLLEGLPVPTWFPEMEPVPKIEYPLCPTESDEPDGIVLWYLTHRSCCL